MQIEWISEDGATLAHASKLRVGSRSATGPQIAIQGSGLQSISPHHALSKGERGLLAEQGQVIIPRSTIIVAGEPLQRATIQAVGYEKEASEALLQRLRGRLVPDHINLAYPRVPASFTGPDGSPVPVPKIDAARATALTDVQLGAGANLVVPPMPGGLESTDDGRLIWERTRLAIQTTETKAEAVGYIPATSDLSVVRNLVALYVKDGVRFFAVDFAGSSAQSYLMRSMVGEIRERLKIGVRSRESGERYYLHAFNVAVSRRSSNDVAPITDIINHPYSIDSTSGRIWGGGEPDVKKLRYYQTEDYGNYRKPGLKRKALSCPCQVCKGHTTDELFAGSFGKVYRSLRTHRISAYQDECAQIVQKISKGPTASPYVAYLEKKTVARGEISRVLQDVHEIRAAL